MTSNYAIPPRRKPRVCLLSSGLDKIVQGQESNEHNAALHSVIKMIVISIFITILISMSLNSELRTVRMLDFVDSLRFAI